MTRLSNPYRNSQMFVGLGLAENASMDEQATHNTVLSVSISLHWKDELILTSTNPRVDKCSHCFRPVSKEGCPYCTSRMSNRVSEGILAEVRKMPAAGTNAKTRRLKALNVARTVRFPNDRLQSCDL